MIVKGSETIARAMSTGSGKNYPYTDSLSKSQLLKSPVIFTDGAAAEVIKPGIEVTEEKIIIKVNDYKKMAKLLELISSIYEDEASEALDEVITEHETYLETTR